MPYAIVTKVTNQLEGFSTLQCMNNSLTSDCRTCGEKSWQQLWHPYLWKLTPTNVKVDSHICKNW